MSATVWNDFRPALHPCVIESYDRPNAPSFDSSTFLCGQYELDEKNVEGPTRGGSIIACSVDSKTKVLSSTTTDCPSGVLDMKISGSLVASAQSDHTLFLHRIQHDDLKEDQDSSLYNESSRNPPKLVEVTSISAADEGLFLSVDWDLGYVLNDVPLNEDHDCDETATNKPCGRMKVARRCAKDLSSSSTANIAVSTQQGSVIVYQLSSENDFSELLHIRNAHQMCGESMPVWITCFDPHSKNILVTGGDDCTMKLWDIRQGDSPTHTNKAHNAGVTSAQWHPIDEHVFASGSYDESLRIWDHRVLRCPVAEIHVGGGVWRTKWNVLKDKSSFLFLSCMQGGSAIVEYDGTNTTCEVKVKQRDEKNDNHLAYGIDLINIIPSNGIERSSLEEHSMGTKTEHPSRRALRVTVASCSFYDNLVQVWDSEL